MEFHEPNGNEGIEPGVGHRFHRLRKTLLSYELFQRLPLGRDGTWIGSASDNGHVAVLGDRLNFPLSQTIKGGAVRHGVNEIPASLPGVGLELGAVH